MASELSGKLEKEFELNSSADEFYKVFRQNSHHVPHHAPNNIQQVLVHEGDWETSGSIRIWHYIIEGREEVFKEKVEFDDEKKIVTFYGVGGHPMDTCKLFKPVWEITPKENGCKVKCTIYYERKTASDPIPYNQLDFMVSLTQAIDEGIVKARELSGKLEREFELKSSADEFYKVFRQNSHHIPKHAPNNIRQVLVHEGDWETSGSIRIWHYTIEGREEVFKERVEFDDEKKIITFYGVSGHPMDTCKLFKPVWELTPKDNGCKVRCTIYYERKTASDPIPYNQLDFMVSLTKAIDEGIVKG